MGYTLSWIRLEWDKRKVRYTRRELETWSGAHEIAYTWSGIHTELETHGVGHIRGGKHSLGVGNIRSGIHTRGMQTEWDTRNEINTELNTHGMGYIRIRSAICCAWICVSLINIGRIIMTRGSFPPHLHVFSDIHCKLCSYNLLYRGCQQLRPSSMRPWSKAAFTTLML